MSVERRVGETKKARRALLANEPSEPKASGEFAYNQRVCETKKRQRRFSKRVKRARRASGEVAYNMSEDRRRILDMLAQGKISAAEAEQLLSALGAGGASPGS